MESFTPVWSLVTVRTPEGPAAGVLQDGEVYLPVSLAGLTGVLDVVRSWPALHETLHGWSPSLGERVVDPVLELPLRFPSKVLCSGPNFTDHLAEMGESSLGDAWVPYFFLKPPTTTLIANGDPVLVDDPARDRVDWEGELAVIIGVGGRRISADRALKHVAGYAVANDISLRGPHRRTTPAAPFQWDWLASKGADTSLPLGPGLVPQWLVPDPGQLRIITTVNGEIVQDGSTASMVFGIAELVAHASTLVTLEPGDVLLTGTPAGVGASRGVFLADGDVVEVSIPGIGTISNPILQRKTQDQS